MTKNNKNTDHLTFRDNVLNCLHCGDTHEIPLPMMMDEFGKEIRSFIKRHADCKAPSKAAHQYRYSGSFGG